MIHFSGFRCDFSLLFPKPNVLVMVGTITQTGPVPLLIRLCKLSNQWNIPAGIPVEYPQELHAFLVHMIGHSTCQALHLWGHLTKTRWLSKKAQQRRWLSLVMWWCYCATGNPAWSKPPESWRNMKSESESEVTQSCLTLCNPMDSSLHQAPPSMGFSRQKYWSGLPFLSAGNLPNPGIEPRSLKL